MLPYGALHHAAIALARLRLIETMVCPHCKTTIHASWIDVVDLGRDGGPHTSGIDHLAMVPSWLKCPECHQHVLSIKFAREHVVEGGGVGQREDREIVWPRVVGRPPPPPDVPDPFAQDYREACLVQADSPKASAALSRRCLQAILRDKAGVKPSNLSSEIDEAMPQLPPYLAGAIDAVRNVGNFAAHPMKSKSTGEVLAVEPGEAEWLLDVLEGLFAFYFVEPAALKQKRDELDAKLIDAGKPPLKGTST